jgi:hypothetical protein
MPLHDNGFMEKLKHVAHFGQHKISSKNTGVI